MYFSDMKQSLEGVTSSVINCLDVNDNFLPSACGHWENAHDSGRWIEAALLLEATVGAEIPKNLVRAMLINFKALMSNPFALLVNDVDLFENKDDVQLHYHSIREAFMALAALVKYRGSQWAIHYGETLAETVDRRFFEKSLSDGDIRRVLGITEDVSGSSRPADPYMGKDETERTGRAIEAMVLFVKETGSKKVLAVLEKCVKLHRELNLNADGSAPPWMTCVEHVGHNHSYLGTLRGLLLYGLEYGDTSLVEGVYNTYKNSVYKYNCSYSGFAPHDLAMPRFSDGEGDPLGDQASCADVAYIAFLLASKGGYKKLYDDVQRLIRARLFKFQTSSGEFFGSWGITGGGLFQCGTTVDVFCLIASTLCLIYNGIISETEKEIFAEMSFSAEGESLSLEARRDTKQYLRLNVKQHKDLYVRLPEWCPVERVEVSVPYEFKGDYIFIGAEYCGGKTVDISYFLPENVTEESTWKSGKKYRLIWRGDDLIGYENI